MQHQGALTPVWQMPGCCARLGRQTASLQNATVWLAVEREACHALAP